MATLRHDAVSDEWVILAPERASRSNGSGPGRPLLPSYEPECPFCPGNEETTPAEIGRSPRTGPWRHRVMPNLYPAVSPGLDAAVPVEPELVGAFPGAERAAAGAHEVVVESPLHNQRLDEMPTDDLAAVLRTWRDRSMALSGQPGVRAVVVFKNFGERAGISVVHPHSQIIATPVVPPEVMRRAEVAARYHHEHGRSVFLDLAERELAEGVRLVGVSPGFVAITPFASRLPYETWVIPFEQQASFTTLRDDQAPHLATLLRDVAGALRRSAGDPDYNLVVHTAPVGQEGVPFLQWYIRVLPRVMTAAGFELGSGMWINCVAPERAAATLRESLVPAATG
ncbi:MAG TPA: galactose-1-phosphate uridylyltransferase [Actinomycetota bacterium]|nr:galactose-1-phosphate uridylyltransferase [Actinomycetota bacterium]